MTEKFNSDLRVSKGEAVRAEKWNRVVDRLTPYAVRNTGGPNRVSRMNRSEITILNSSGSTVEVGELQKITSYSGEDDISGMNSSPAVNVEDPSWPDDQENFAVAGAGIEDTNQQRLGGVISGLALVKITMANAADQFAMMDPAMPRKMKSCDTGLHRIVAVKPTNDYAIVHLFVGSRLWKYELNENFQTPPATTDSKLLCLDNTQFHSSVAIEDPDSLTDDLVTGDQGYCWQYGDKYRAIQAPC